MTGDVITFLAVAGATFLVVAAAVAAVVGGSNLKRRAGGWPAPGDGQAPVPGQRTAPAADATPPNPPGRPAPAPGSHPPGHPPGDHFLTVRFFSYHGGCVHIWDRHGLVRIVEAEDSLDDELRDLLS